MNGRGKKKSNSRRKMRGILKLLLLLLFSLSINAQHQELAEKPEIWKEKEIITDTTSILSAFRRGKVNGNFRYFFMATDNKQGLTDYYANAIGGGIKYETARLKNFQFGVSGYFIFNLNSSDLHMPDHKTGQLNRYEIGLFDIQDPNNKSNIDRVEELYLKYYYKNSSITFGKQLLNSPFINLQDGRMRPTEVEGIWFEVNEFKKSKIQLGYLYSISPRSTVHWYKIEESIGVYPVGVNEYGIKSDYKNNLKSKGIFIAGITQEISPKIKLQVLDQYTENIFNSAFLQLNYESRIVENLKLITGFQVIRQDALKDGGNADPLKTYIKKGSKAWIFGSQIGLKNKQWETTFNYTRITANGKYLMPREWGRDPFFTFMPRERNEGFGDVHAFMVKSSYKINKIPLTASIAAGHFNLPDVVNYELNKYGLPSYNQLNIDIRYKFSGFFKGFDSQLLYVHKANTGNTYGNEKYVINKTDMNSWNLVINYQF